MKLSVLIARLREECPSFVNRVGGVGDLAAALEQGGAVATPHAFVVRLAEDIQPSVTAGSGAGAVTQPSEEFFGVVVCVANGADGRGLEADDTLDDLRSELLAALKGWAPDAAHGPLEYRGFETLDMTRARLWRRFDFSSLLGDV
ncbi:MAG TPA: hypothetical protein VEB20_08350 [Azospirillaceae bacterium]|nr:hypothetical protein [Azospirillaceae bacterium]